MPIAPFLHQLSTLWILHDLVQIVVDTLILCLIVRFILSWVLRGQQNGFSRFFENLTAPVVAPLERLIPPISLGGLSLSIGFIAAFWLIIAVGALLGQALPPGW